MNLIDLTRSGMRRGRVTVVREVTSRQAALNPTLRGLLQTGEVDAQSLNMADGKRLFVFGVDTIDDADVVVG